MDYELYKSINGLSGEFVADSLLAFFADDLPVIVVVLVALTFLVPWAARRPQRRSGAVPATASAGVALLVNQPIAVLSSIGVAPIGASRAGAPADRSLARPVVSQRPRNRRVRACVRRLAV